MSLKQKFIAVFLAVIFIVIGTYLLIINYGQAKLIKDIENEEITENQSASIYSLPSSYSGQERYKIMNIVYSHNTVYAIIHLDNGNIKVLKITEAYVDPDLNDLNCGYLYRENGQIYIRSK